MPWTPPDLNTLVQVCRQSWLEAKAALLKEGIKDHFECDYELRFALFLCENIDGHRRPEELRFASLLAKEIGWTSFHLKQLDQRIFRQPHFDVHDLRLCRGSQSMATAVYLSSLAMCLIDGDFTPDEKQFLTHLRAQFFEGHENDRYQVEMAIEELFQLHGLHPDFFSGHAGVVENEDVSLEDVLQELDQLIGLSAVKDEIKRLVSFLDIQKQRRQHDLPEASLSLHMVFTGSPGTGKTTVARLVAKVFKAMGILKRGHLVETDRSGLVGQYVGHTEVKTNEVISKALDGILFIDEAYALLKEGGENDFGREAIDALVKRLEDDRHRLIVIVAGYRHEMERFLEGNVGLKSRFNTFIDFPNYESQELVQIFEALCQANQYQFGSQAQKTLDDIFNGAIERAGESFGNGRFARNLFEKSLRYQAFRLSQVKGPIDKEKLMTLEPSDLIQAQGQNGEAKA